MIAYLTSVYPAVSHTFIMREILALRQEGIEVATFSVRRPGEDQLLTPRDRAEAGQTTYLCPVRWGRLIRAHAAILTQTPLGFFRALWFAVTARPGGLKALLWQLFYFGEAMLLCAEMRRRKIRHVHVHFGMACASVAMIASVAGGLSYSLSLHGPVLFYHVKRFQLREKVARALYVLCISEFCRSQVMAHTDPADWKKLHIVHCGVPADEYATPQRPAHGKKANEVLCVGRLVPEKAQSLLLHTMDRLRHEQPDLRLTLVGDGQDRARLEHLRRELGLEGCVTLTGSVGQNDIHKLYEKADIFVLPSFAEGLPVVLMEAMKKGVPVISTRIAGIPELVEDGRTGILVPPGNVDALVQALKTLIGDSGLRARFADHGRRKVEQEFDMESIGKQVARIVRQRLKMEPRSEERGEFDSSGMVHAG